MDRFVPTLTDVARHAGVSYATADRVVNGRGNVAEKSVRRVEAAIKALGYTRNQAAANLSRSRTYRFAFVLPGGCNSFFEVMGAALEAMRARAGLSRDRVEVLVERVAAFDPEALARKLDGLRDVDGIAVVAIAHPRVMAALGRLRDTGVHVVSLVSDVPGVRDAYIGIDNLVAGQTAGRLIALAHRGRSGVVLPIVGGLSVRDHAERLEGLRRVVDQAEPSLTLSPEIAGRDDPERVGALVRQALQEQPEITAIYSLGAGNSGLIRVLQEASQRPMTVLHELAPYSRAALAAGLIDVVIDQRPEEEIARALSVLRLMADHAQLPDIAPIVPALYVKENLPPAAPSKGKRHD